MKRLQTNFIVDIALFLAMALLSISGLVLKGILPFGSAICRKGSHFMVMGMERCVWKDIHLWSGVIILVLLIIHVALHWNMIAAFFKKHIPNSALRYVLYTLLLLLSIISIVPWIFAMG
ncbi:MAG: DUF4405 domain-containing protein [Parabacteroides sp.]|nr:DUF4405 domain-containing protein [Parabacteroides sp.]